MSKYSKEDIIKMVKDNGVKFIRLQFTDIFGQLKNVAITDKQLEKALNNECMFDGSSIDGFANIEESDMNLRPNLDSFVIFPWRPQQGKVARLICDIYKPDGTPFTGDPRLSNDASRSFYLTTYGNNAFIQTGHTGGQATEDEQEILANIIFYTVAKSYS